MKLKPLGNKFTFKFVDAIVRRNDMDKSRTQFEETTDFGFTISSYDESAKTPRWAIVMETGPEIDPRDFASGSKVLITELKWSEPVELWGDKFWYSDLEQVLAVED